MFGHMEKAFDKFKIQQLDGWEGFKLGYMLALLDTSTEKVFEFEISRQFLEYFERLLKGKKREYRVIEQSGPNVVIEVLG